jgi:hypothetical protein
MEKRLGRITNARFGYCHGIDIENQFGLEITIECINDDGYRQKARYLPPHIAWDSVDRKSWHRVYFYGYNSNCQDPKDMVEFIKKILKQAKVDEVVKLKGIPVQLIKDDDHEEGFRIVTELL